MNRWIWFFVCAILGVVFLAGGLLVPMHLRAVDVSVIQKAGQNTPAVIQRGVALAKQDNLGAAQMLHQAAETEKIPDKVGLGSIVGTLAGEHPAMMVLGSDDPLVKPFAASESGTAVSVPFTQLVIQTANRRKALAILRASPNPAVRALLGIRNVTNTVIFPPSHSAAGQALDAAVSIGGLLLDEGQLTGNLRDAVVARATAANRGGNSQPVEEVLMDLLSLGQRLNWGQLVEFVGHIQNPETLHRLAGFVRNAKGQLPVIFSAVELSGKPGAVAGYLVKFSQTGMKDLGASLAYGRGGIDELLSRDQRLYRSGFRERVTAIGPIGRIGSVTAEWAWHLPVLALSIKWLLYLACGFLLAAAMHFARPAVSALERPLQVRGFHLAREFLFALGFLFVVLLLSEPFLSQEAQKAVLPFRLHLPTVGVAAQTGSAGAKSSFMSQSNLMIILLFFVLQGLLYTACVVKLAEIRRQHVGSRMKLKLLENEEHLFDAGLYLGFLGTIISFIVYSLYAHHQFSLMVAYSSTSFGILFVSFFKIFHLRPVRRRLLLEAEGEAAQSVAPSATPTLASP